ncbi:MAG TPA: gliding motility-associated protein GldE, partial [Bacteroidia bacterium]|nr:gliding motility-associated protein GldE [Bacteroidia bacterium]
MKAEILLNHIYLNFIALQIGEAFAFLLIFVFIILSALVSCSETALFSITSTEKAILKNSISRKDRQILLLLDNPKHLLAALLVANNFFNLSIIILSAFLTGHIVDVFAHPILSFSLQVVLVTLILLVLCDIIPKAYASGNPLKVTNQMLYFIFLTRAFFYPFASILTTSTSFMDKYILRRSIRLSKDDLSDALELASQHIPQVQQKILKDIIQLGNKDVKEIMQPRMDIVAFNERTGFTELLSKAVDSAFSRIPVFRTTPDNMIGILYTKDLLVYTGKDDSYNWRGLLHPPFFVPESKKISDLLEDFRKRKMHLAIVVDEFGSTSGLVTLEDIVEEILGEINDEFDEEKIVFSKLDDHNYVFEGKVTLGDFCRTVEIDEAHFQTHKGGADTLAGLIMEIAGRIPEKNEKIKFENLLFTIEAADKRRIQRVKVTIASDTP